MGVNDYWNHNTAYHRWLVATAARHRGRVLDVGCGEGLLVQRLAAVSGNVVGIDSDPASVGRARQRLQPVGNASVWLTRFEDFNPDEGPFDVITFVASLHHMPLRETLLRVRELLTPQGELAVVGVSANKTIADWAWEVVRTPPARVGSRLHREIRDVGVPVAEPSESLDEIRGVVDEVLPAAVVRRGLYYRYRLSWRAG